jgi:cyclase
MKMEQVSNQCFAAINEKNRVCDANSGFVNVGGGMVVDTQSDLAHAQQMIDLFSKVWPAMPARVVNTHEDSDHVYGNQLFPDSEIIGHRSLPDRMKEVAEPAEIQKLMRVAGGTITGALMKLIHPGVVSAARQLKEDYDFSGVVWFRRQRCSTTA